MRSHAGNCQRRRYVRWSWISTQFSITHPTTVCSAADIRFSTYPGTSFLRSYLVLQLIKKFPAFYGNRKCITVLTSARHLFVVDTNAYVSFISVTVTVCLTCTIILRRLNMLLIKIRFRQLIRCLWQATPCVIHVTSVSSPLAFYVKILII